MSYNVGSIDYLSGQLEIKEFDRKKFARGRDRLPEGNFIEEMGEVKEFFAPELWRPIDRLSWYSEGSGHAFQDVLIKKILPLTRGSADFSVVWENGDTITGLRVVDGKVTEHEVIMTLGEEKK